MSDDIFDQLDADIARITSKTKLEEEKKRLNQHIRKTNPDRKTRILLAGEIKEINEQLDSIQWFTTATVALFQEQHCTYCGSKHRIFLQFMNRQETTSGPKVRRLVRATKSQVGLIHEVILDKTETSICADCATDFGFDLDNSFISKFGGTLAVPRGYKIEEEELPEC